MSQTKHTKGPWEAGLNPSGGYSNSFVVRPAGEFPHGLWIADCGSALDEERIANARLIAAAPELLDALKALRLQALQSSVNSPANEWGMEALAMANAAISKAELVQ